MLDTEFEVELSFDNIPEKLVVPFNAVKGFLDPSVQFGLQFETVLHEAQAPAAETKGPRLPLPAPAAVEKTAERRRNPSRRRLFPSIPSARNRMPTGMRIPFASPPRCLWPSPAAWAPLPKASVLCPPSATSTRPRLTRCGQEALRRSEDNPPICPPVRSAPMPGVVSPAPRCCCQRPRLAGDAAVAQSQLGPSRPSGLAREARRRRQAL